MTFERVITRAFMKLCIAIDIRDEWLINYYHDALAYLFQLEDIFKTETSDEKEINAATQADAQRIQAEVV
jgi:hypothetical protein